MSPILTGVIASGISGNLTPAFSIQGGYDSLATVTLTTATPSVTFTGIPTGYKHLQIRTISRDSDTGTGQGAVWVRFNSDSATNYSWHRVYGNGGAGTPPTGIATSTEWILAGINAQGGTPSGSFGATVIDILDYSNSSKNKTLRAITGSDNNTNGYAGIHSGAWYNTSPVTSITLNPTAGMNFQQFSQFALYGVK